MTRTWLGWMAALAVAAPAVARPQPHGHDTTARHEPVGRAAPGGGGHAAAALPARGPRTIAIAATTEGFVPARIVARRGERIRLAITRTTERTCATRFVVEAYGIDRPLPVGEEVDVELTPTSAGTVRFGCPTGMAGGVLVVE